MGEISVGAEFSNGKRRIATVTWHPDEEISRESQKKRERSSKREALVEN
jgi:hypothetical protein